MKITKEYLKQLYDRYEALDNMISDIESICDVYIQESFGNLTYINIGHNPVSLNVNKEIVEEILTKIFYQNCYIL